MADSKISGLTDGGGLASDDELAVARAGVSYRVLGVGVDGWISDLAETWTYASGSGGGTATFTVPGDVRSKYTVGTRIKLTQAATVKYFVVSADSTFASSTTTVTITGGSDYTLANSAISANYHSYMANPQGYPGWFNFAAGATGFSSFTDTVTRFSIVGRQCFLALYIRGTSNASTTAITLPVAAATATTNTDWATIIRIANNGAFTAGLADIVPATSTTVMNFYATPAGGGFTASGFKVLESTTLSYPV